MVFGRARRGAALMTLVAVAAAASGCGGSTADPSSGQSATAAGGAQSDARLIGYLEGLRLAAEDGAEIEPASERGRVEEVVSDIQLSLAAGRGQGVCFELTPAGLRELARLRGGSFQACKDVIREISVAKRRAAVKTNVSDVTGVRFADGKAVVKLRDADGSERTITLVQPGGTGPGGSGSAWRARSLSEIDPDALGYLPERRP